MEKEVLMAKLSEISIEAIEILLDEVEDIKVFTEVFEANQTRPEVLKLINEHPFAPEDIRAKAAAALNAPLKRATDVEKMRQADMKARAGESKDAKELRLGAKIARLSVGEKIRLASRANKEIRNLLLKDSNKQVVVTVVENPKLTDSEAELIAKSRQLPDEALRSIAKNREFTRNYNVVHALVTNPKTPAGISMGFLARIKEKDLALLESNKNVPEAIRMGAKRLRMAKDQGPKKPE